MPLRPKTRPIRGLRVECALVMKIQNGGFLSYGGGKTDTVHITTRRDVFFGS